MSNLIRDNSAREFYIWVDETNPIVSHNLKIGSFFSALEPSKKDNMMFIPNPNFSGFVSMFQSNLLQDYKTEYNLELSRRANFNNYPSRLEALFLFGTTEEAIKYRVHHPWHVGGRPLVSVRSNGDYLISRHDVGWIDFLHQVGFKDDDTMYNVTNEYWKGTTIKGEKFLELDKNSMYVSTLEILYLGRVDVVKKVFLE